MTTPPGEQVRYGFALRFLLHMSGKGTRVINLVQSGVYTHDSVVRNDFASSRTRRTMPQPIQGPVVANTLVWPPRAALCGCHVPRGRS